MWPAQALLPCISPVALGMWNRELDWSQELQRGGAGGWHLNIWNLLQNPLWGRALGPWPPTPSDGRLGSQCRPLEGYSWPQVRVLPMASFSIGILGAQGHPRPQLTSWASPSPQPISADGTSLPAQTPPVLPLPGPARCSVILSPATLEQAFLMPLLMLCPPQPHLPTLQISACPSSVRTYLLVLCHQSSW